jgi:hypothetical protein
MIVAWLAANTGILEYLNRFAHKYSHWLVNTVSLFHYYTQTSSYNYSSIMAAPYDDFG